MSRNLIDRDRLKKEIHENDIMGGLNYAWYIDHAELVDAVEVVRGEWIATRVEVDGSRFTGERCSRCGWWKSMGIYNYCPNCGAKMDGEVESDG